MPEFARGRRRPADAAGRGDGDAARRPPAAARPRRRRHRPALLELATKAPTGSNRQGWEFVVVRDPDVKHQLARLNRQAWSVYRRLGKRRARGDRATPEILDAVQWQADHFEEVPVVVVACLHGRSAVPADLCRRVRTTARSSRRSRTSCSRPGPSAWAPPSPPSPSGRPRLARRTLGLPARVTPVRGGPARLAAGAATAPPPAARSRRSSTSTVTGTGRFSARDAASRARLSQAFRHGR